MGKRNRVPTKPTVAPGKVKLGSSLSLKNRSSKTQTGIRDKATVKRLNMYKTNGPKRNKDGKIVAPAEYQKPAASGERARIEPNRKWFGNTRTLTQQALQKFQVEMGKIKKSPYQVIMKSSKLPVGLLKETSKTANVHILKTESFESTFGPKKLRKRPKLNIDNILDMIKKVTEVTTKHDEKEEAKVPVPYGKDAPNDYIFAAGQSKRIHAELFKVIDSSDVVVQVLDARDPMGTRSKYMERHLKEEKSHKHLIFILNKCDLVPTWVTKGWLVHLSAEYPTLAFHASVTKSFGKGALINLLRQFARLHSDKKQISVGFIGYPNVGKSSIINTLKHKKCCKVAPLAGETKVWQYVSLFRRVNLIDCPGVVSNTSDSNADMMCKGVVRLEYVTNAADYIETILEKIKPKYLTQAYKVESWTNGEDFLAQMCKLTGKLLKRGEPDLNTCARMVFQDFQRGKLPYFNVPPNSSRKSTDEAMPTAKDMSFIDEANEEQLKEDNSEDMEDISNETTEEAALTEDNTPDDNNCGEISDGNQLDTSVPERTPEQAKKRRRIVPDDD